MQIPLLGDQYAALSPAFSAQTCINLYPELDNPHYHHYLDDDRKTKYSGYLLNTPGTFLLTNLRSGAFQVRGLYEYNGTLYAVADGIFYVITQNQQGQTVVTSKGTLLTAGQTPVRMVANFTQIGIFDGPYGYVYTPSTGVFQQITDINFAGAVQAIFQDGYTIIVNQGTNTWQLSQLNDMTVWPPNYVSSISGYADNLISLISFQLEIGLLGQYHGEIWDNLATVPFPFARRSGINIDMGCIAPLSIATLNNTVMWLTQDRRGKCYVVQTNGYTPMNVTTDPIVAEISNLTTVSDAIAYAYDEAGHLFYVLTFPTENKTFVYDASSQMWHKRSSKVGQGKPGENPINGRHISNCYAFWKGMHIVGDYQSGNLYIMSRKYKSDNGTAILRERTLTHLTQDLKQSSLYQIKLDCQVGQGTTIGAGNDPASLNPQIGLEISRDYGVTWGRQRLRNIGPAGHNTPNYVRWNANGRSRNWTLRFRGSDAVDYNLLGIQAELTQGSN